MHRGYYQNPTVFKDRVVFVCEEDLWTVPTSGGIARRLTAGRGGFSNAVFSPDGESLAVSSSDFGGREIFIMPSEGGDLRRLTWLNHMSFARSWRDNRIVFSTWALDGNMVEELAEVPAAGGEFTPLKLGPAIRCESHADGTLVVERNMWRPDSAHWKRYRGGTAGKFFVRKKDAKEFQPFLRAIRGNLSYPMWIGDRFYFLSDHDGIANIYSTNKMGSHLKQHTQFTDFYVRNPSTDGERIVFHAGAELFIFDPKSGKTEPIEVKILSQRVYRQSRMIPVAQNLEYASVSSKGDWIELTSRGQIFQAQPWQGAVYSPSRALKQNFRDRLGTTLSDTTSIFVTDELGDEKLVLVARSSPETRRILKDADCGRVVALFPSPLGDKVALTNHRNEILIVDIKTQKTTLVTSNRIDPIGTASWSPDGKFLAYVRAEALGRKHVAIFDLKTKKSKDVTRSGLGYRFPVFSPKGDILYFLGAHNFNPRYETQRFSLYFQDLFKPYALLLNEASQNPMRSAAVDSLSEKKKLKKIKALSRPPVTHIDWTGISERIVEIPASAQEYFDVRPTESGLLLGHYRVPSQREFSMSGPSMQLDRFEFSTKKQTCAVAGFDDFWVSGNHQWILYLKGQSLKLKKVMDLSTDDKSEPGFHAKSGSIDLSRFSVPNHPVNEWKQIFHETWRLQEQHFWEQNLGGVDWNAQRKKYEPLLARVSMRSELSDLLWELIGELGVSHAYMMGGDLRLPPTFQVGSLGADFKWDRRAKGYRVDHLLRGYPWNATQHSPLLTGPVQIHEGDCLLSINRAALKENTPVAELLTGKAGCEIEIEIRRKGSKKSDFLIAETLRSEGSLRYRDWVESRREIVRKKSDGRLGYLHIPDMGPDGYAEFFEQYLQEFDFDGLIIDVRFNGGGHVSQLILGRLLQKRVGLDQTRWFGYSPYPAEAPAGPLVGITNEFAGSDGDIFSHCFKLYNLGPLVGSRTWGGVIGIWPRHKLMDGGYATQPEFAFWFQDVGWDVEGHGTDPTIPVENWPHDHLRDYDRQLDVSIETAMKLLKSTPPFRPQLPPPPKRHHVFKKKS